MSKRTVDYDVVIVGGGIQGVGIAQACSAAGYRCLVLEKNTIASATSCASSKLIHGGLRYLESAELSMVRECLIERKWLLKNASELVKPVPFYIPVYHNSSRPPWMIFAGLSMYALLSGLSKHSRFKVLPKRDWDSIPGLNQDKLKAVFQYWDAATDDRLLTESVMRSAQSIGCDLECHAEVIEVEQQQYQQTVRYQKNGETKSVSAFFLVNAAGPWVNELQSRVDPPLYQLPADLVQGVHLVIKGQILSEGILYLEHPEDQRAVFVMPWYGDTLLGTTEKTLGSTESIAATEPEKEYLLRLWAHYFPNKEAFVLDEMVGARVLPASNKSSFKRSREARLLAGRLSIAVYGGKLTSFRAIARKTLEEVAKQLGKRKVTVDVNTLTLTKNTNN